MTIQQLQTLLNNISRQPARETILEFSFALLQWMGVNPNPDFKRRLLPPQAQKREDGTATASQAVQPRLYRLSADGQDILVRFAVLKKIKNEYIGRLADNDPVLTNCREGSTQQPGSEACVGGEPYRIHFVTTVAYDRLLLMVNEGGQTRMVSFHNRLSHTQYNKIIPQWQNIAARPKPEIAGLFWKGLDSKELNKEFYKKINERFDALAGFIKTQCGDASESGAKKFSIRMIGRYLFCWFLKEKEIISQELIGVKAIAQTEGYYQNILCKLFFEILNTTIRDRDPHAGRLFENVPYLNGGLFDKSEEDVLFHHLQLDSWLLSFAEILERYDFTPVENSSHYSQAAVDPEMMGRIFENLLAGQNGETEKSASQRKAFGAFYTPCEITDYMVAESIKACLQTLWEQQLIEEKTKQWIDPGSACGLTDHKNPKRLVSGPMHYKLEEDEKNIIETALEPLFARHPGTDHLKKEEKAMLLRFLEGIKILDPACGSGAFTMGILHRLAALHEALGPAKSRYEIKTGIWSRNIYGVDIMPMAIEIARLRAWLSLLAEEEYQPGERGNNFGIKPLPDLAFTFACGNSLIDPGLDACLKEENNTSGTCGNLVRQLNELNELRKQYYLPAIDHTEKEKLQARYLEKQGMVITNMETAGNSRLKKIAGKIKRWNPFDNSGHGSFFSPAWMFGVTGGFDVVIGNPPYVQIQKLPAHIKKELAAQAFETFERKGDIYQLFFEKAIQFVKEKGIVSFITSNQWMRANYGQSTRALFSRRTSPLSVVDLGINLVFETAAILTSIFIGRSRGRSGGGIARIPFCRIRDDFKEPAQLAGYVKRNTVLLNNPKENAWVACSGQEQEQELIRKIEEQGTPIKDWNIRISCGIKTGCNKAFIIDEKAREDIIADDPESAAVIMPVLRGEDIKPYAPAFANLYLIATFPALRLDIEKYRGIRRHLERFKSRIEPRPGSFRGDQWRGRKTGAYEWYETQDSVAYYEEFKKPKIIYPNMTKFLPFMYDEAGAYACNDKAFIVTGEHLKFLTVLLNSTLWKFAFKDRFPELIGGTREVRKVFFDKVPVKKPAGNFEKILSGKADEIIKRKKAGLDTAALEQEADVLVYKLYGLTYEEVKVIDRNLRVDAEAYEGVNL